jgi:predicted permease
MPRLEEVTLDPLVLAFSLALAIGTGLLFGSVPAWQLGRARPADALREGGRGGERRATARRTLVVAELAVALMLLTGAGLLLRSFSHLTRVEPGLDASRLITVQMRVPRSSVSFITDALARLEAIPGVRSAAVTSQIPLTGRGIGAWFNMYSRPLPPGVTPPAEPYRVVSPGFFETAGIPLIAGRLLEETDGREAVQAVVVNEALAGRYFPNGDAIGQEIYLGAPDNRLFERAAIVGVVGNTRDAGLGADPLPTVYSPHRLMPYWDSFSYLVRTDASPVGVMAAVRRELRTIAPGIPIRNLRTMDEIVHESVAPARTSLTLIGAFAIVAVTLAAVGVFGVLSYLVSRRTRELGVRLALGAAPSALRMAVVRQGLGLTLAGVTLGLLGAAALNRVIRGLLYGITSTDLATYASMALLLLVVGGFASWLPARRATRVDPVTALRNEG